VQRYDGRCSAALGREGWEYVDTFVPPERGEGVTILRKQIAP